jgi:hypothetical protein
MSGNHESTTPSALSAYMVEDLALVSSALLTRNADPPLLALYLQENKTSTIGSSHPGRSKIQIENKKIDKHNLKFSNN